MRINEAKLINSETLTFGDFNVFIGGNGVGKTTTLLEIFHKSTGLERTRFFWINDLIYNSQDISKDLAMLKNSFSTQRDGASIFYFSNAIKNIHGTMALDASDRLSVEEYEKIDNDTEAVINDKRYRKPFIAFSSCESRLSLPDNVEMTPLSSPPEDSINVLFRNKILLEEINKTVQKRFKYNFVLLDHKVRSIDIGISKNIPLDFDHDADDLQSEFNKIEKWKEENFIPITEAGHGIRSMIKLLTSLLEPVNQIILIDEPELHLYPSQKRWLGKQLVSLAKDQNKQIFMVTHDPLVLQGVFDVNTATNIFRVDRDENDKGVIKYCAIEKGIDIYATNNRDDYLQALFYQRCIVVEGASDRAFYQNMLEDIQEIEDKDLGVVMASGKGGTKALANIASKVGLEKIAYIYDFDAILHEPQIIGEVYNLMGGVEKVQEDMENLFKEHDDIMKEKDSAKRFKKIKEITSFTEKTGSVSTEWYENHKTQLEKIFTSLAQKGIFIVPNGNLEIWAPTIEKKSRFAEEAPDVIKKDDVLSAKFYSFAKTVLDYVGIQVKEDE